MRSRKKIINLDGVVYRDKQEALDHLNSLERTKSTIHGLEIVILSNTTITTDMYKTVWFSSQLNVYETARSFIAEKMGGAWNYIEFK
jgi:ribonucleotide monophosphatase NagD (HAD superfamily)